MYIQLFSAGVLSDGLRIWKAKMSDFDVGFYIDIQLVCGAGFERTRAFPRDGAEPEAEELLAYLESCDSAGNFQDFTPEGHPDLYRRYYPISHVVVHAGPASFEEPHS